MGFRIIVKEGEGRQTLKTESHELKDNVVRIENRTNRNIHANITVYDDSYCVDLPVYLHPNEGYPLGDGTLSCSSLAEWAAEQCESMPGEYRAGYKAGAAELLRFLARCGHVRIDGPMILGV